MLPWHAGKPLLLLALAAIGACGGQTAGPRVDGGGSGHPVDGGEMLDGTDFGVDAGMVDAEAGIICTAYANGGSGGGSEHFGGERETCSNGQAYSYWERAGIPDDSGGYACFCDCCLNSQCGYGVQPNATVPCPDLVEPPDGSLSPQQYDDAFFAACGYPY